MCVCVCVCVCVCTLSMFATYLRCSDQRSFVVSIARGVCEVLSSLRLKMSYLTSKDENSKPV